MVTAEVETKISAYRLFKKFLADVFLPIFAFLIFLLTIPFFPLHIFKDAPLFPPPVFSHFFPS